MPHKYARFPNPNRVNQRLTLLFTDVQWQVCQDVTLWTKVVARKKKCSVCGKELLAGSNSIRYTKLKTGRGARFYKELCICKDCALPKLKAMVEQLEKEEHIKGEKKIETE